MGWDGIESLTGRRRHSHPEREVAGSYLKGTRKAQKKNIHRLLKMRPGLEATNATLIIPTLPTLPTKEVGGMDVLAELLH